MSRGTLYGADSAGSLKESDTLQILSLPNERVERPLELRGVDHDRSPAFGCDKLLS